MPNVAINGLGRIGRAALKILLDADGLDLVAVNDIADVENLAYLLKYDTVYGRYHRAVGTADGALLVDGRRIAAFAERDPANLPWADLGVDLVLECTGVFTSEDGLTKHIQAGASYVILSAPTTCGERAHRGAWREPPRGRPADRVLRKLHHQLHHPRHRGHAPPHRGPTGGDDDDPRLHRRPTARRWSKQELPLRPGRCSQPGAHLDRSGTSAPPAPYRSWPAGSTGSRCARRSRSGRVAIIDLDDGVVRQRMGLHPPDDPRGPQHARRETAAHPKRYAQPPKPIGSSRTVGRGSLVLSATSGSRSAGSRSRLPPGGHLVRRRAYRRRAPPRGTAPRTPGSAARTPGARSGSGAVR